MDMSRFRPFADLRGINLTDATLTTLRGSNLTDATPRDAVLARAGRHVKLYWWNMSGVRLDDAEGSTCTVGAKP